MPVQVVESELDLGFGRLNGGHDLGRDLVERGVVTVQRAKRGTNSTNEHPVQLNRLHVLATTAVSGLVHDAVRVGIGHERDSNPVTSHGYSSLQGKDGGW